MRKATVFIVLIFLFLTGNAAVADDFAAGNRGRFGNIDGYLMFTRQDDLLNNDPTTYKSELSLYRTLSVGKMLVQPYYYFKNEMFNNDPFTDLQITENTLGLDFIITATSNEAVTMGLGYLYRTKSSGNNDGIIQSRVRLDF